MFSALLHQRSEPVRCCSEVIGNLFTMMVPALVLAALAAAGVVLVLVEGNPASALILIGG